MENNQPRLFSLLTWNHSPMFPVKETDESSGVGQLTATFHVPASWLQSKKPKSWKFGIALFRRNLQDFLPKLHPNFISTFCQFLHVLSLARKKVRWSLQTNSHKFCNSGYGIWVRTANCGCSSHGCSTLQAFEISLLVLEKSCSRDMGPHSISYSLWKHQLQFWPSSFESALRSKSCSHGKHHLQRSSLTLESAQKSKSCSPQKPHCQCPTLSLEFPQKLKSCSDRKHHF